MDKWFSWVASTLLSAVALAQLPPSITEHHQNIAASGNQIAPAVLGPSYFEFPTTANNSSPTRMTLGPDGATWFVEASANNIGRITPAGVVAETMVPTANSGLAGITVGSDGALWFTESNASKIGRITTAGVITNEFPIILDSQPSGIVSGPDGALWFTEFAGNKIGRLTTSGTLTEFSLPTADSQPLGITLGSDGSIWFTEYGTSKIGRLDPASGTIIETALTPGSGPQDITPGPIGLGGVWFTESLSNKIGQVWAYSVRPPGFSLNEFPVPTPATLPSGIVQGPDGAWWFTESATSMIGRITTGGQVDEFPAPSASSGPAGIILGPDGELWFSESNTSNIVRSVLPISQPMLVSFGGGGEVGVLGPDGAFWFVSHIPTGGLSSNIVRITTSGGVSLYPTPTKGTGIWAITPGPDGALWFTEPEANKIGWITTGGTVTEYPLSFGNLDTGGGGFLLGITSGPDAALWFTEDRRNKIGRITPDGATSEYSIPTANSAPLEIVLGPDGALWFSEQNGNKIGRITTNAAITEYMIPSTQSGPGAITVGPDGALWFVESDANKIGRITTSGVITEYAVPPACPPCNIGLSGIKAGPDGAVWFTEFYANKVGRITTDGTISEYEAPGVSGIVAGPDGMLWLAGRARISLPADSNLNTVKIIGTNPPGLTITVDGGNYVAPQTFTWTVGSRHTISVASTATAGGAQYSFTNWSDSQPQSHTISAGAAPNVYIANYIVVTAAVPNVVGLAQGTATIAIQNEGLVPGSIVWAPSSGVPRGSILSQNPAPGKIVNGGATVDLVISSGPQGSIIPLVNGVISASAFGAISSVAPGSWIEIYGSNLALEARGWSGSDFDGNNAPISLDGVKVSIAGQSAFVDYISPTQVNAQLPSNIATGGTLPLTVANGNSTSAPFNVMVNATEPGLLTAININGSQYVEAKHLDGAYVLPTSAAVNSRPARLGETVVIYGVGFGPVTPNMPAGQIATQTNQLSTPLEIMFGQTPAQLSYFGLAPGLVGLYQFNVTVPAVLDSDLVPLTFSLGGVAGKQILFTAVHR